MSGTEEALRLDGVSKRFGQVTALHEAWLRVQDGEFLTLLGPSGCGKTTLLNLIAGFLEADAGEIFIGGRLVTQQPVWERDLGMVFQSYALFPHMDVARNVGYGLRARGVGKAEAAKRVEEALALVRLSAMAGRRPRELSGGQQQRVALARALVIRPRLLLLDEPFSALDRNLRAEMQIELKEIQQRLGVTTIFVTHDQGEAMSMSDRVAVMSEGRILQLDTPEGIYRRPSHAFVAGFVGDSTVLSGRLARRNDETALVRVAGREFAVPAGPLAALGEGGTVSVYFRPEHLSPSEDGLAGTVVSRAYLGDRAELVVAVPDSGRILLRVPGVEALHRWPAGAPIRIGFSGAEPVAFPL
ncbi:ABC transporter ATP-binding protein [Roseococcus sp. YIM B11640]|uniref:ABC transporter ATP-binding protein n=1 Tax=Roseococcus sp. YIM B11640 TaxID=3133973 RepID=UPI003C7A93C2